MNKRQLVAAAAKKTSLTRRQMGEALEALLEAIAEALEAGDYVALSDFGRFSTQKYAGRSLSRFGKQSAYAGELGKDLFFVLWISAVACMSLLTIVEK